MFTSAASRRYANGCPVTLRDFPRVGYGSGRAARLATLARAGFAVPGGFCLKIGAHQQFFAAAQLSDLIRLELRRFTAEVLGYQAGTRRTSGPPPQGRGKGGNRASGINTPSLQSGKLAR
jgi:hypothetical protein